MQSELLVVFTKRRNGDVVLRCQRVDGSATWQRHTRHAAFFSAHDITHFAVEKTLGFRRGFYGLVAEGWEIEDTTGKGTRGPLPGEAIIVEHIVGLLSGEAGGNSPLSAEDFNTQLAKMVRTIPGGVGRVFTDAELNSVRSRISELRGSWARTEPGSTLELIF